MGIRWEYHVLDCRSSDWATVGKDLNRLGADGWEIVWGEMDGNIFVLKRLADEMVRKGWRTREFIDAVDDSRAS